MALWIAFASTASWLVIRLVTRPSRPARAVRPIRWIKSTAVAAKSAWKEEEETIVTRVRWMGG